MSKRPEHLKKPVRKLYEDGCFIAFDKPSGLLVTPTPKGEKNTLINIVNQQHTSAEAPWHLHPCHRLDRDTSGVILFAKGKRNQRLMREAFKDKTVSKKYIAFVHGKLQKKTGELKSVIRHFEQKKYQKHSSGKQAITRYKVIGVKKKYSIVEVEPVTGRTNQIRIHFRDMGHPLVGERKYAFARDYNLKFKRVALHALSLAWMHPIEKRQITVTSNLSQDMEVFLARNKN